MYIHIYINTQCIKYICIRSYVCSCIFKNSTYLHINSIGLGNNL